MSFSFAWHSDTFSYHDKNHGHHQPGIQQKKKKKKVAHNDGSSIQSPTAAIELACKKLGSSADNQNPAKSKPKTTVESLLADALPAAIKKSALKSSKKVKKLSVSFADEKSSLKTVNSSRENAASVTMRDNSKKIIKTNKVTEKSIKIPKLPNEVPKSKAHTIKEVNGLIPRISSLQDKGSDLASSSVTDTSLNCKSIKHDKKKLGTIKLALNKSLQCNGVGPANMEISSVKKRKLENLQTTQLLPSSEGNSNVKKRKFPADSTPKETQEAVKILANSNAKKQKEIKKPTAPKKTRLKREEESDGWEDLDSDVDWEAIDTDDCEVIDCSNEEEPELDENFHSDLKSLLSELNFDAVKKQMEKERLDESDTGFETDDTEEENSSESDHDSQQPSDDDLSDSMRGDESRSAHSVNLVVDGEHKAPVNEESKLIKPIKHVKAADVHKIGASLAKFGKCPAGELPSKLSKSQSLAQKMQLKLNVAKFRMINEQLYKISGEEAQELFKDDPESFKIYHDGFQSQVALWPLKPLDIIIDWLKIQDSSWVVADFGCGEGELAERVQQKVHSLDLVAIKPHVTACDMAHTPLRPQSVNVAVFCLSLMGTNVSDFIKEANRTLKPGGILKIAEVESRITNVEEFVAKIQKFGFKCCKKPVNHNYFVSFDFKKVKDVKNRENLPVIKLKPCLYKKR
ncbi:25S rRNA (adenine-N(1))-methyltransferase isoform X2 [Hyalella azteca]|uniref:Ribosomal RNA-processing protein 8 n=1 Tax=Hyalella azteca TaxID=294128 RepID=A0A8B7N3J0_HYAAZ|nr:25S rRNA (adenine-N(1))-methyltransferase isoform X2 [Hyalella azteca]